jgi:uncharacterized protein
MRLDECAVTGVFTKIPETIPLIARLIMGCDPAHGWPHVVRVHGYTKLIARHIDGPIDWRVLEAATALHDVGRFIPGESHHAVKSAEIAGKLLPALGLEDIVADVEHAILAHSYSLGVKPKTLEAAILSDADKLDALGAVGIARVIHTGCKMNRSFEESLNHFHEKILRLPELMHLEFSKELAREKAKIIAVFVENLESELGMRRD